MQIVAKRCQYLKVGVLGMVSLFQAQDASIVIGRVA